MKKKLIFFMLTLIFLTLNYSNAYAVEGGQYINVRIRSPRQENEIINISGEENIQVLEGNLKENSLLFNTDEKDLVVKIDSYYNNGTYYNEYNSKANFGPYHIIIDDKFNDFEKAKSNLEEIEEETNLKGYVYYDGNNFYPVFGRYTSENKAKEIASDKLDNYDAKIENHKSQSIIFFDEKDNPIFSYRNNFNIFLKSGESESIYFDGKKYHGNSAFYIIDEYKLLSINLVTIEDYLKGVVPSEIPASWHEESLKAQAVAARTYAVANTYNNPTYGYHVVDNQNSQVYNGIDKEYASTNKAVEETKGELIYYKDGLITAFYHSTSGGKTADSGNVWSTTLPYLRSVEDDFSNISPHTEWVKELTKEEIVSILKSDFNVSDIYDIELVEVSEDERVLEISFKTDRGEINFIKEEIRAVIGYSELKSTWFTIEKNNQIKIIQKESDYSSTLNEKNILSYKKESVEKERIAYNTKVNILSADREFEINSSPDAFILNGRGWGHGIGMSQYGARQMAEEGFTYKEILEYYYTGVEVRWQKIWQKKISTIIYQRN